MPLAAGRWVFLNPAWEQLTGYRVADSLGQPTTRLLHPDDLLAAIALYPRIAAGELTDTLLHQRFLTATGECSHIEISVRALWTPAGVFDSTIGNIRDVTERHTADHALRDSERRFQTLANHVPVGLFRLNAEGLVVYTNRQFLALSGLTAEQAAGTGWLRAIEPDDRARLMAEWPQVARSRAPSSGDLAFRHGDGAVRWLHASSAPLIDEDDAITG